MNYENAADILPEDLLKRVQKFAAGKLIYVPETTEKRPWGETSGYKQYLTERNQVIKEKFIYMCLSFGFYHYLFVAPCGFFRT